MATNDGLGPFLAEMSRVVQQFEGLQHERVGRPAQAGGPVAAAVTRTRRRPSPYESAGSNCRVTRPATTQSTERQDADATQ